MLEHERLQHTNMEKKHGDATKWAQYAHQNMRTKLKTLETEKQRIVSQANRKKMNGSVNLMRR